MIRRSEKIYPIKYPTHAPKADPEVAINAILNQLFILAIVIGIIKRSGGKGNIKLSKIEIKPKIKLALLWDAHSKLFS